MIDFLKSLCFRAIIEEKNELHKHLFIDNINVYESKNKINAHFQFNDSINISKILNLDPMIVANFVKKNIEKYIKSEDILVTVTKPGFVNFILSNNYIENKLKELLISLKVKNKKNRVILDYSSPNIAKNMHIGHLRSTVVGECIANLLLFVGNKIIRVSHLGDWGTQFGLLIYYLKTVYKGDFFFDNISLDQLSYFYKDAQEKFIIDTEFALNSKKEVFNLQNKDKVSLSFWKKITYISKNEYKKIYFLLDIKLKYKGESFYNDLLTPLIKFFNKKSIIKVSDGANCIYLNDLGFDNSYPPLIIQKSDKAYNYATTELAALYYRIKYYLPDKIVYITDIGQSLHFDMVFKIVKFLKFDINNKVDLIHIPLGLMLNLDGKKIKTRSGISEKLIDVLFESIKFSKNIILEKNKIYNKNSLNYLSRILGINTVKYSDLSNKLDQNYIFDKSIAFKNTGNTASFLMYAYVRICGIKRKIKKFKDFSFNFNIKSQSEVELAIILIMYKYFIKSSALKLNPNILTNYTYKLAEKFHSFFHKCDVINSDNFHGRFILCELTRRILKICFKILGLKTISRM